MQNATRFELTESQAGVGAGDVPHLFRLRQQFLRPIEADVRAAVHRELAPLIANVTAGQRIAITGSSRGISNFTEVVAEAVRALRARGAEPFVVPGMGSHGGATAEGQVAVLNDTHGLNEDSAGCPVQASMDVIQVGTTADRISGLPGSHGPRRRRRVGHQPRQAAHRFHRASRERSVQDARHRTGKSRLALRAFISRLCARIWGR